MLTIAPAVFGHDPWQGPPSGPNQGGKGRGGRGVGRWGGGMELGTGLTHRAADIFVTGFLLGSHGDWGVVLLLSGEPLVCFVSRKKITMVQHEKKLV